MRINSSLSLTPVEVRGFRCPLEPDFTSQGLEFDGDFLLAFFLICGSTLSG